MLRLVDVRAGYGQAEILQQINLEVNAGEVVTLIGANGAGKTTTLRAICGLVRVAEGEIHFDGRRIDHLGPHEIVDLGIAMVPEGRQLFPFMTVYDNLMMGAYRRSVRGNAKSRIDKILDLFPRVRERLAQKAGTLSGGEQQMVAIARGLAASPRLLIFDEPSLGLAPMVVKQVFDTIKTIVDGGTTVLVVEQNIFHTLNLADRGYVLENGRIVLADTGAALLADPHVRTAYLGM